MQILKPYKIELADTLQQHWYHVWLRKRKLGTFPSSTTILNAYPQSEFLTKWIAEQGWHESQAIKSAAGERGTFCHKAIEELLNGAQLSRNTVNQGTFRLPSTEEWYKISTFVDWYNEYKPKLIANEMPVFSKKYGYCGRTDYICEINGEIGILDFKSSNHLHNSFPLQFASYAQAVEEMTDLKVNFTGALQLGTRRNKKGYRYEVYDNWKEHLKVFLNVKEVWNYEYGKEIAPVLVLPETLQLNGLKVD